MALLGWLDGWLLRAPFEGAAAARYAADDRPAFGDLDGRVLEALAPDLPAAGVLIDVGAGTGAFARRAAGAFPAARVVAVEPSAAYAASWDGGARAARVVGVRGRAEALPLADGSADVAVCLSSLRHAGDRPAALAELRRVVRRGGAAWIVEVDTRADGRRVAAHLASLATVRARLAFRWIVLGVCPPPSAFAGWARHAGWSDVTWRGDRDRPFFLMRLA